MLRIKIKFIAISIFLNKNKNKQVGKSNKCYRLNVKVQFFLEFFESEFSLTRQQTNKKKYLKYLKKKYL